MFVLEKLIEIIAPYNCLGCHAEGSTLCGNCILEHVSPVPSRCYMCKSLTKDFEVCVRCRRVSQLSSVWVVTPYGGLAQYLLRAYKFERAQAVSGVIGGLMADLLPAQIRGRAAISPIPTATSRQRVRGYDHSLLLAKTISQRRNINLVQLLGRLGQTRQVGSSRIDRLGQLNNAYFVKRTALARGASVILVDDIITTGGTLEAAAKVLKQAGAKSVSALVFAQKS
jgi:ComF family protein